MQTKFLAGTLDKFHPIRSVMDEIRTTHPLHDVTWPLHDPILSIKIDCLVWSTCNSIIGPYFFRNEEGADYGEWCAISTQSQ